MEEKQWYKMLIKPCKNRGLDITLSKYRNSFLNVDSKG
jgi:hypothetical protein